MSRQLRHLMRNAALALVASGALVLWACPAAGAYTAPTLTSPANNTSFTEGGVIDFTFNGTLQGDSSATDRSFFRVELAAASDVDGLSQQASWPTLTNFVITESGKDDSDARAAEMGVPDAGTYKWRVCAWGVQNAGVSLDLAQLVCSSSRTVTTKAASSSDAATGEVTVQHSHTVVLADHHEQRVRDTSSTDNTSDTTGTVQRVVLPRKSPVFDTPAAEPAFGDGNASSVHLGGSGLDIGGDGEQHGGALDAAQSALGATLPLIPIPYWSLLLFIIAMPLTHLWRKDLLAMFQFTDEHGNRLPDEDEPGAAE